MPNWFINLSSPLLGIPLSTFFWATFIGLIPANYIHVTTGVTLESLTIPTSTIFGMILLGLMALIPTFFKKVDVDKNSDDGLQIDDLFSEEELLNLKKIA